MKCTETRTPTERHAVDRAARLALVALAGFVLSGLPVAHADDDPAALQGALVGTWESVPMGAGGTWFRITMTIDGAGKATDVVRFYSDAACTNPTGLVKHNTSTYTLGEKVDLGAAAGGKTVHAVDIDVLTWELKQGGTVIKRGGKLPTQYDILAIDGDTLYNSGLTRTHKGPITNSANRPTTLDTTHVFKRKAG